GGPTNPPEPTDSGTVSSPPQSAEGPIVRMNLGLNLGMPITGMTRRLSMSGFNSNNVYVSPKTITATSTNAEVIRLFPIRAGSYMRDTGRDPVGPLATSHIQETEFLPPGPATLRGTVDGYTDSIMINVEPEPPPTAVLVAESFVFPEVELRCTTECIGTK